jgi:signal transduction histidine kinase
VQALHSYSRGDSERRVDVDVHRALDESLELLRHHLKQGITVERRYAELGRVRGYAGQLQQVFMNILTNAAQAVDDRTGRIRIETAQIGKDVVVRIADDGPGIAPEVLPRIFDPFFTTKDVGQGSGLGLSIVHGIVERHGGRIDVESALGRGTTFTLTLPQDTVVG